MSIKRILAAAAASVVAVSAMAVVASAAEFSSSLTMADSTWWTQETIMDPNEDKPVSLLIGDNDPADVESITFTCDTEFIIGYNSTSGEWYQPSEGSKEFTCSDIVLESYTDDAGDVHDPHVQLCLSKGDGVEYTISWTVNLKGGDTTPAEPDSTPEDTTPSESTPEESKTDDTNKPNVDTGVEGVAAVVGVAAVAAGAMIVAKKRK